MTGGGNLGAIGSGGDFGGFEPGDFDAFQKKKWASNAYTLERRRAKDRLLALVRAVQNELAEELGALELGASDEAPSVANGRRVTALWVFFTRPADERAALKTLLNRTDLSSGAGLFDIAVQHQHACVVLQLDEAGLTIGLELANKATVDRENAAKKLEHRWARDQFVELAKALPNGTTIGFGEGVEAIDLDADAIEGWVGDFSKSSQSFVAQMQIVREEELLASDALIGTAVESLARFLPILEFLAWSRDNDHTQVKDAIKVKKKKAQEERAATLEPGARVTILSGLFSGRGGYVSEVQKGKAKVMVGPVSVTVDVKDLKSL